MTAAVARRTVGVRLAEDLNAAADLLEREGWVRECLHSPTSGHDVTGAIYAATGYHRRDEDGRWVAHPLEHSAGRRATDCITWLVRNLPAGSVWEFNDRHCLNQDAAVDALRRAADAAVRQLSTPRDAERLLS